MIAIIKATQVHIIIQKHQIIANQLQNNHKLQKSLLNLTKTFYKKINRFNSALFTSNNKTPPLNYPSKKLPVSNNNMSNKFPSTKTSFD